VPDERAIQTQDGRTLAVVEGGDPRGRPVLVHHGTPGSALLYPPLESLAREMGVRLLSYDRSGYGGSTRTPERRVADCVVDVHAIADALELDRLAAIGFSGGGPHALACAALCDGRLAAAALLGSVAPYGVDGLDWLADMGEANVVETNASLEGEAALRAYLEPAREEHLRATPAELLDLFATLAGAADREVLSGPLASWQLDSGRRGLRDGVDGWLDDDFAFVCGWGFDVAEVDRPVLLLHGEDDRFVPVAHARWLAERIPGVDARIGADDGHLTLLARRSRETIEWLLERL